MTKMINMIDVGYTDKINLAWKPYLSEINYLLSFNPLIKSFNSEKHCHLQLAITDEHNSDPKNFNVYKKKECSSFFKIDEDIINKRTGKNPSDLELESVVKIGCTRLDEILISLKPVFNYLKIDTQGSDLNVIKSAGKFLKDIWAVEAEVFFSSFYENAPMADEVVKFMDNTGDFRLVADLRKPNPLFGDFLFINHNAPQEFLDLIGKIYYKCKSL